MRTLLLPPAQKALRKIMAHRALLDKVAERICPRDQDELGSPTTIGRRVIMFGMWMVFWVFGIFGLWAAIAPLNSAAIAPGFVIVESNNKTVQHQEGGIVDEIMVTEGMFVEKGQPLLRLNETAAKARLQLLRGQFYTAKATEARLLAERDNKEEIEFPPELEKQQKLPEVAEVLDAQRRLFESRRNALIGQIGILGQRIEQSKKEIDGLSAQATSAQKQVALLEDEISVVRRLLQQGNAVKPRLLGLEREAERLKGLRGEYLAQIARSQQGIGEAELAIVNQKNDFLNKVVDELSDVQVQLSDLEEKIRASADIMDRIIIAAPISGKVKDLKIHTVGGVIGPGEKLMDIVPLDERRVIEAQVSPMDIDVVREGLDSRIRLTAFKARNVSPVEGKVIGVSADREVNERTGQSFFKVRVELDAEEMAELLKEKKVELYTGMPAEVLIITGSRTMLSYMMDPIRDTFNRAFREQ